MTDTKALIAEARGWSYGKVTNMPVSAAGIISRLAAALEEATPPEGWRVTEYTREDGMTVTASYASAPFVWMVEAADGGKPSAFSTARAAMEALENGCQHKSTTIPVMRNGQWERECHDCGRWVPDTQKAPPP